MLCNCVKENVERDRELYKKDTYECSCTFLLFFFFTMHIVICLGKCKLLCRDISAVLCYVHRGVLKCLASHQRLFQCFVWEFTISWIPNYPFRQRKTCEHVTGLLWNRNKAHTLLYLKYKPFLADYTVYIW